MYCALLLLTVWDSTSNMIWGSAVVDEQAKREIKELLMQYDRTLLVADPRRCEPKKYATIAVVLCHVAYMLSYCYDKVVPV